MAKRITKKELEDLLDDPTIGQLIINKTLQVIVIVALVAMFAVMLGLSIKTLMWSWNFLW